MFIFMGIHALTEVSSQVSDYYRYVDKEEYLQLHFCGGDLGSAHFEFLHGAVMLLDLEEVYCVLGNITLPRSGLKAHTLKSLLIGAPRASKFWSFCNPTPINADPPPAFWAQFGK